MFKSFFVFILLKQVVFQKSRYCTFLTNISISIKIGYKKLY